MKSTQIFVLSPANCSGQRAALLFNDRAQFFLARQIRQRDGAPLADVFSFLSGLYFRGKVTYARAFSRPPFGQPGIWSITTSRGLVQVDTTITLDDLREFASVPLGTNEPRYYEPLTRDASRLAAELPASAKVVLLGSIATSKYVQILEAALGDRLIFPDAFIGRGDMSRGGLLLRAVDDGCELNYIPVTGSLRRGSRPAKLPPRRG